MNNLTNSKPPFLVFYCKECEKLVDAKQIGHKHNYRCPVCDALVSFGTEKSIKNFYHLS